MIENGNKFSWVGFFQEDEASTKFVRLTDDLSSKQEAIQWIEAMMEDVAERKEG